VVVGPAVVAGVSVHLALVAASAVAAAVMGYAVFVDPPTGVGRQPRQSTTRDAVGENPPVERRSDTS